MNKMSKDEKIVKKLIISKTSMYLDRIFTSKGIPSKFKFGTVPIDAFYKRLVINNRKINYKMALQYNLTNIFKEEIKIRKNTQKNLILGFYGETGSGKSHSALRAAELICMPKKFESKNVFYSFTNMLNKIPELPPQTTMINDEPVLITGMGGSREKDEILQFIKVCRKKQFNVIFVSPNPQEWLGGICHYWLRTWDYNYDINMNRCLIGKYSGEFFGHVLFFKPRSSLVNEYERMKDDFIEKTQVREGQIERYRQHDIMARRLASMEEFKRCVNNYQRLHLCQVTFPNLNEEEHMLVMQNAKLHVKPNKIQSKLKEELKWI